MELKLSLREGEDLTNAQCEAILEALVRPGQLSIGSFVSKKGNPGWAFNHKPVNVGSMLVRVSGFVTLTEAPKRTPKPVVKLAWGKTVETPAEIKARRAKVVI